MRQAIRALGWASNVFWIILLFFTVTAAYSAFQLRPGFGVFSLTTSNGTFTVSLPFYVNNGGFYDISNLNLTTVVMDNRDSPISSSSTLVRVIPRGSNVSATHNMSISTSQITTQRLSYLLFSDTKLDVDIALKLIYANAVPFKISMNSTMDWDAPLKNLTLGLPSPTATGIVVPISFENNSFFELNGTMRLEIVGDMNKVLGQETININVQPKSSYKNTGVYVSILGDPTSIREARLYFGTSVFNYGPVVIPIHV